MMPVQDIMPEQQLIDYIRKAQEAGASWDTMKTDLLSAGWMERQIDEAYRVINIPKPSIPVPSLPLVPAYGAARPQYTSRYSGLLAAVLVVSLLILTQNAVTDLLDYFAPTTVSSSFRMVVHALIVVPFWIITFLFFALLKDERKKYEALLVSYYLTSGWLLVFLFFDVAQYIYNANSTIGVYIVFGMLAVILTGAVWVVQKYRHSLGN